jgi:putative phosphonate metabolism protein
MDGYTRYAVFWSPPPGPLARFGAAWLGWDAEAGHGATLDPGQDWPDLPRPHLELTEAPRKYGLHGTLKPPFELAEDRGVAGLHAAVGALAPGLARVKLDGLRVDAIGPFLALVPEAPCAALDNLAATLVETLDGFRAPPGDDELARRRAAGLTDRQEAMLRRWGYPYVMDEFRFHVTLTGPIEDAAEREAVRAALSPMVAPLLDRPFRIDDICLFGEGQDGRFRNLHRYALTG